MRRYEPSHLDLCCLKKPIINACDIERVKMEIFIRILIFFLHYSLDLEIVGMEKVYRHQFETMNSDFFYFNVRR